MVRAIALFALPHRHSRPDYHTTLLNHLMTTMLGVHPCAYEQWIVDEEDDIEDDYAYSYADGYPNNHLGRRFGPFVAGSLPITPVRELNVDALLLDAPIDMPSDLPPLPETSLAFHSTDLSKYFYGYDEDLNPLFDPQRDGLLEGDFVIDEISMWDSLRDASAWGVMLFLVLVSACLLVWAAFINACCSMRYAGDCVGHAHP